MKIKSLFIYTIFGLAITGCDILDHLDREVETDFSKDQVFNSYGTMRDFGIGVYSHLPHGFDRFNGGMLAAATDEAVHSGPNNTIQRITNASWGPYDNPDDQWNNLYSGIRKANMFLENTVDFEDVLVRDTVTTDGQQQYMLQTNHIRWLRAETLFLKAYFYFELSKRYGGVPIIDRTLSPDEDLNFTRSTYDDTIDHIFSLIDDSIDDMRTTWVGVEGDNWTGRATQGAARALKARVLLYAASPVNNTGNDQSKWLAAAEAAHDVIAMEEYSLAENYRGLFRSFQNDEIILARQYAPNNTFERTTYPVGFEGAVGGTNPSQNLVDAYETINGLSIDEDPAYDPQNPYAERDPRLGMTIILNNFEYKGRPVEIWNGGMDGPGASRATRTGYYLKKYADENLDLRQNTTSTHSWILLRYAEVLLNYAEAMNEIYGPDDNGGFSLTAREALNMVRSRPGVELPGVNASSQHEFRERVRNERKVELAFEEHRFWDARRWLLGTEILGSSVYGVEIMLNQDHTFTYYYPSIPVEGQRIFQDRMYLYPIPHSEISKTGGMIEQNPGW